MTPDSFLDGRVILHAGDCLDVLDALPADSVDAVITDPPYHFNTIIKRFGGEASAPAQFGTDDVFARASAGFMGKQWDGGDVAFRPETWAKVLRVLKPGGHVAAFSAPKCVHRMGIAIELAGFEVRDRIVNLVDPEPALEAFLDSLTPAQADALFRLTDQFGGLGEAFWAFGAGFPKSHDVSKAIDKAAGAVRPVLGARRAHDTRGGNLLEASQGIGCGSHEIDVTGPATPDAMQWSGWGTALKPAYEPIVIARKPLAERSVASQVLATGTGAINIDASRIAWQSVEDAAAAATTADGFDNSRRRGTLVQSNSIGKESRDGESAYDPFAVSGRFPANLAHDGSAAVSAGFGDAVRFFFSGKADGNDRVGSAHPTVKPVGLMQWLCRMLTPPGGTVLDPFAGTGATGEAAWREGFSAVLIEREAEYRADIARRMALAAAGPATRRAGGAKAKAERKGAADHGPLFGGTPPRRDGRQIYGEFADENGRRGGADHRPRRVEAVRT